MKTGVILCVGLFLLASCTHALCPTYNGTRGYSASSSYSKKQRNLKNAIPYYKILKRAEVD
ncbi:MAG: hypothetical protein SH819_00640 [Cytophagales bacterium]|nr:hypothetical protein [Cytophagales bacterium]